MAQIEAVVERLHVLEGRDRDPRIADFAVNVGPLVRIEAVERHRIESGRQALRRRVLREHLEAGIGAEGIAFAREHAGRVLPFPLEGKDAAGVGEGSGDVLEQEPAQELAMVLVARQHDFGHARAREGRVHELRAHLAAADLHHVFVARIAFLDLRPDLQKLGAAGRQCLVPCIDQRRQRARVGTLLGEHHGRNRSGNHRGQIDDPISLERPVHGVTLSLPVRPSDANGPS